MQKNREEARQAEYRKILRKSSTVYREIVREEPDLFHRDLEMVLAPALDSFVLWVLKKAQQDGIKRLYFLARDGYFMYRCARIYCAAMKLPVECRYLSCSRYSVRIPVFHLNMEDALDYICRGGIDVTIEKILSRSGIGEEEKAKVIREIFQAEEDQGVLPYARLGEIREKLRNCGRFMENTYENSRKAYPCLQGYLRQEGLMDPVKAALVDSGWVGSMQKTLNLVLVYMGRQEKLTGYYWGLYELPQGAARKDYFCYAFSPEKGLREKVYFSNCLFETIFSAPHGMTMGYRQEKGKWVPVYAQIDPQRAAFMKKLEQGFVSFTKRAAKQGRKLSEIRTVEYKKTAKQVLELFMGKPTRMEAETFGILEFSDDVLDFERQQIAEPLSGKEIRANHVWNKALTMLGIRHGHIKESAWYEGSVARYGRWKAYHLFQYRLYKYLLYMRKKYYYLKMKEREDD